MLTVKSAVRLPHATVQYQYPMAHPSFLESEVPKYSIGPHFFLPPLNEIIKDSLLNWKRPIFRSWSYVLYYLI